MAASRPLSIRSGETRAERAAWAVMSLNPIVVAGAVLGLEDEFGRSQLSEYDIALNDGTAATVRSRYVAQPGQCVMMRRALHTDQVILIGQDASLCTPPP